MKRIDQVKAIIDAYIELAERDLYTQDQIRASLLDVFDEEELVALGFGYILRETGEKRSQYRFTTPDRMMIILSNALNFIADEHNGRFLLDTLKDDLKMTDDEIIESGFSSLERFMEEEENNEE